MNFCDQLDDFLAHDLSGDVERQFVEHLADCAGCREAVNTEQHMAHVLTQASRQLEPMPRGVAATIRRRQVISRTRYYATIAAAIVAVVVTLSWLTRPTQGPDKHEKVIAKADEPSTIVERPPVRVTFGNDKNMTAVPIATDQPNVTVYWVFPDRTKRDHQ